MKRYKTCPNAFLYKGMKVLYAWQWTDGYFCSTIGEVSSKTLETLLDDKDYKPRTLLQIPIIPDFETDPVLFIWKNITINSNTIFNEGSIEILPEIKTINDNYNENLLRISQWNVFYGTNKNSL